MGNNIYRIRELLKKKDMTYESLGDTLGISKTSIYRIANGDQHPGADKLLKIAEVLDVDIRDLFVSTKEDPDSKEIRDKLVAGRDALNEAIDMIDN